MLKTFVETKYTFTRGVILIVKVTKQKNVAKEQMYRTRVVEKKAREISLSIFHWHNA